MGNDVVFTPAVVEGAEQQNGENLQWLVLVCPNFLLMTFNKSFQDSMVTLVQGDFMQLLGQMNNWLTGMCHNILWLPSSWSWHPLMTSPYLVPLPVACHSFPLENAFNCACIMMSRGSFRVVWCVPLTLTLSYSRLYMSNARNAKQALTTYWQQQSHSE